MASRRLYPLRVLKQCGLSKLDLVTIYYCCIRSILEYASPVFVGIRAELGNKLERVQKRAHKIICGDTCADCSFFPSLGNRREEAGRNLLEKCTLPTHPLNYICPRKSQSGNFVIPNCRTNRRRNSFFPYMCIKVNNVRVD